MLAWMTLLLTLVVTCFAAAIGGEDPTVVDAPLYDCSGPSRTSDSFIDYDHLVHCSTLLERSPVLARVTLVICLIILLYLLSSTADEFFCPVLQAIVEKYRIPPHVAGVTFLSFGNGSPDVFSNIAAFATPMPSIAVTAILGGGLLVTTVITACVGLASNGQEQLIPRTFLRDVVFYLIAVCYLGLVFFDGIVRLPEALGFLCIYLVYVSVVFLDKYLAAWCYPSKIPMDSMYALRDDEEGLLYRSSSSMSDKSFGESSLVVPIQQKRRPYLKSQTIPVYDTFYHSQIFSDSEQSEPSPRSLDQMLYRKCSLPTPRSESYISDKHGLLGRDEGKSLLEVTDAHLNRPSSMCAGSIQESLRRMRRQRRQRKSTWELLGQTAQFGTSARRWTRGYHVLSDIEESLSSLEAGEPAETLESTLDMLDEESTQNDFDAKVQAAKVQAAGEKQLLLKTVELGSAQPKRWTRHIANAALSLYGIFMRVVWNPFEIFTVFVRRLTIPLVDEDTWNKNLVVVCPPFAMLLFGISVFSFSIEDPFFLMTVVVLGGFASAFVEYSTSPLGPPEGWQLALLISLAFGMSVVWIMNIANEVLAVLETLGALFGISSSVLGVSVLAWGNSIGDLVSNMAIARDGFPTMAFAGCFAGPMFNLLVGVGLSLTINIISRGPLIMSMPSPLMYLGFGYLLLSLLLNFGMASWDNFRYRPRLCYTLMALYASFAIISIFIVLNYPEE